MWNKIKNMMIRDQLIFYLSIVSDASFTLGMFTKKMATAEEQMFYIFYQDEFHSFLHAALYVWEFQVWKKL